MNLWQGKIFAQEDILERLEELEAILHGTHDAIIVMAADGTVRQWNSAAERMFGYTAAEVLGRNLHELIVPEQYKKTYLPALAQFQQTGTGPSFGRPLEMLGRSRAGTEFPVEITLQRISTPRGVEVVGIVRDITERKELEKESLRLLQQRQELQHQKAQEIRNMVHDLKNLTTMPLALAQIALFMDVPFEAEEALQKIIVGLARLNESIEKINRFQQLQESTITLQKNQVRLKELLLEIIYAYYQEFRQQEKVLKQKLDLPLEFEALVDESALRSILNNLIGNAQKYTKEKQEVLVTAMLLEAKGKPLLKITVEDTGEGIDADDIPYIFEAYRQAKNATGKKGTGVGLASVKRYIELMQGNIAVQSERGAGTIFTIEIPLVERE